MKHCYFFPVFVFLFLTTFCHAQLSKGTKTIGIGSGADVTFGKNSTNKIFSKYNNQSIDAKGSVGYFLSKKWLVSGSIGTGFTHSFNETIEQTGINIFKREQYSVRYSVGTAVRFYAKNNEKHGIFLFSSIDNRGSLGKTKAQSNAVNIKYPTSNNETYWSAGVGMHKMLNEQIAAEATLYYSNYVFNQVELSVYLRNFIKTLDKKNQDTPLPVGTPLEQYIAQHRWLVDGKIGLSYLTKYELFGFGFDFLGGKMITNKLMVGSRFSTNFGSSYSAMSASPFVRYYIPITTRLYVFPYIGSSFYYDKNGENKTTIISFDRGIGYNYFLTRNVALSGIIDANIRHYGNSNKMSETKNNSTNLIVNAGISYFLK